MSNLESARRVIALARELGADDFCVCGGSRNAPLIAVLSVEAGFSRPVPPEAGTYTFVDERSAAFFALGRAKLTGRPVSVITTSGTAAAELLPAAVEAHYSGVPLILITADRPARYRGTGAPQAIEQEGIFGVYAARDAASWTRLGPLHINVEFDEPLIDGEVAELRGCEVARSAGTPASQPRNLATPQPLGDRPVVLLGGLAAHDRERVKDFILKLGAPVYAEPLSGLREDPAIAHLAITAGERMIARAKPTRVIRIGNVPTLRFWRDLDESRRDLPLVSYSRLPFAGLSRGEVRPLDELPEISAPWELPGDRQTANALHEILDDEPRSELAMIRELSRTIPHGARVYLGNSLPIREWDLAAAREPRGFTYEANRGANGIDGQLSTFFGQCEHGRANVCVVGDLTAIYDANAPWIVPQLDADFRIVIVNNAGGRIFDRVASLAKIDRTLIVNAHDFRFDAWAAMWRIEDRVTELRPDAEASRRAWARYDALWS
jgi:2-succinyl-5-enolpyruvyl-6-hydroxy-3-cyclohexene-1-carboxylate synthase